VCSAKSVLESCGRFHHHDTKPGHRDDVTSALGHSSASSAFFFLISCAWFISRARTFPFIDCCPVFQCLMFGVFFFHFRASPGQFGANVRHNLLPKNLVYQPKDQGVLGGCWLVPVWLLWSWPGGPAIAGVPGRGWPDY